MVIIHDKQAAIDLMEKRSQKYSSRINTEFAGEMCGFNEFLASQPYNDTLRTYRKFGHAGLGTRSVASSFYSLQETESRRFLLRVLNDPEGLVDHLKIEARAIILKLTYGYSIEPQKSDPLVRAIEQVMENFFAASAPGAWPVDALPWLKHLPGWLPGMGFQKTARQWKTVNNAVAEAPYNFVKQGMAQNTHRPSFVSKILLQLNDKALSPSDEHAIKWSAVSLYGAGSDTIVSTLSWFFLAMVRFPDAQQKAQEEIGRVIGEMLPTMKDRDQLPYLNAMYKEALRWEPVGPMGMPHACDEDDIYSGYHIPKSAILLPAMWWFAHDPAVYHDPSSFKPERYFAPYNEPSPERFAFGFGRRVCAGRLLVEPSLFLTIAQSLAVFRIGKAIDEHGKEIEPRCQPVAASLSRPMPFQYRIVPRNERCERLVRRVEVEEPWEESDAKFLEGLGKA